ncbi:twin-arginine translocation signal domain-containing protein [Bradyrhizobium sp. BWC-3-1]|uniref:twin-arginine translocation signal domain-containing protein n=1 Tax=Bradyrhizobium sp. BWC-3-1 TaxID=3080012 RepID=UPI00397994E7
MAQVDSENSITLSGISSRRSFLSRAAAAGIGAAAMLPVLPCLRFQGKRGSRHNILSAGVAFEVARLGTAGWIAA